MRGLGAALQSGLGSDPQQLEMALLLVSPTVGGFTRGRQGPSAAGSIPGDVGSEGRRGAGQSLWGGGSVGCRGGRLEFF